MKLPNVEIIDEENREYEVGETFTLNLDSPSLTRAGGAGVLRVRIFRGTRGDLTRSIGRRAPDGCVIYSSKVFRAVEYNGGIRVRTLGGRDVQFTSDWLAVNSAKAGDQVYVLQFEKSRFPEDVVVKMKEEDVAKYFSHGYQFVVVAPGTLDAAEVKRLTEQHEVRSATLQARVREVEQKSTVATCTNYVRFLYDVVGLRPANCRREALAVMPALPKGEPSRGLR